jgi:hypothetical protein
MSLLQVNSCVLCYLETGLRRDADIQSLLRDDPLMLCRSPPSRGPVRL